MDMIGKVWRMSMRDGVSIREISRKTGLSCTEGASFQRQSTVKPDRKTHPGRVRKPSIRPLFATWAAEDPPYPVPAPARK